MTEVIQHRAITQMTQSSEASCVPTSLSMVFSGFGIDISEQTLVDSYFQTAKLPATDPDAGVTNTNIVKGIVQVIRDLGLEPSLQTDVFIPSLHQYTSSSVGRYIVEATPRALNKQARVFPESEVRDFHQTLAQLQTNGEIGVYTANNRLLKIPKFGTLSVPSRQVSEEFYKELGNFIRKGHILGPHGGMTGHLRALDGTRQEKHPYKQGEYGYTILDPNGESYVVSLSNLVWVDSFGIRGDIFDYLFRISPREELSAQKPSGFHEFLRNLKQLIP
jgi:hypothetical protein